MSVINQSIPSFSLQRYVEANPSWAKQLEGEMTRGKHMITFTARSPTGGPPAVKASCQMMVHVKDVEPPRARACPPSFVTYLGPGERRKRVQWSEPVFEDNVKIQHVTANFLPGHNFAAGKHNVLYVATDIDGNKV